jgi:site-specific DNA-methyltransferase (adenine-specific)
MMESDMFELIHADCIKVLRNMPDKSVDCIITDPPYGVGIDYGDTYEDTRGNLELLAREALPEMRRVARRVAFTCGTRNLNLYPQPTWVIAWFYCGNTYTPWGWSSWQPILVYGADPDLKLRMRRPDSIRLNSNCPKEGAPHPCPKPLGFMRKLVNRVAPSPADIILDPFMGSGTTGVAAIQLGHKFIGIEINGDYLAIAKRRIAQASPDFQLNLALTAKDITHEHA